MIRPGKDRVEQERVVDIYPLFREDAVEAAPEEIPKAGICSVPAKSGSPHLQKDGCYGMQPKKKILSRGDRYRESA